MVSRSQHEGRGIAHRALALIVALALGCLAGSQAKAQGGARLGVGGDYRLTLGYRLTARSALGLQLGLGVYSSLRWQGTASPDASTGSFLGKGTSIGLYPSLGSVLTHPLER